MTSPDPETQVTVARDTINAAIRDLMGKTQDHGRAEEYARLLTLWNEAPTAKAPYLGSDGGAFDIVA